MSNYALRAALDTRDAAKIAEAIGWFRNSPAQHHALIAIIYDSTVAEIKTLHRWAEDWLSDRTNDALRARKDARWQAVNSVYVLAGQALRDSGTVRSVEIQP